MPNCPNCNAENAADANFCSQCGQASSASTGGNRGAVTSCSYNFVVMGSGGVGKSAITIRFVNRQFEPKYDPTIEDRYQKVIEYQEIPCVLEILDTAGQETFSAMRELYMKNGQGFVLVYSITSMRSLEDLDQIRRGIIRHNDADCPMVLVGNKCDLERKREVDTKVGKEIARDFGCPFLESSAKNDLNISEIFHLLIEQIWTKDGPPVAKKDKGHRRCALL
eukprot:TRINITY_DN11170_c0_g1_i1.p1 TRINITY_DN11170_c0_g1~~TRINITY_DN11170_c0_g1_i1.p1  ORF type:complete len:222 (+),score=44.94 TRINITY_DN11170_c0_g1_i1:14-679(+)